MRASTLTLGLLAIVAVLAMQFSGLHLHATDTEHSQQLHGAHVHGIADEAHGHGHEADVDVPVFDFGSTPAKPLPFVLALVLAFPVLPGNVGVYTAPRRKDRCPRGRARWRPPLRAPPATP